MITYTDSPNFSIVMPGGCNAECSFCYHRSARTVERVSSREFVGRLGMFLHALPAQFRQVSITGGEPLLSPALADVLDTIRLQRDRYRHVVLTTNGTRLPEMARHLAGVVDHVNVSRHHYSEAKNLRVFGGTYARKEGRL